MNCRIEWVMGCDAYDVYLYAQHVQGMVAVARLEDGGFVLTSVPVGSRIEPAFRMDGPLLQAFASEAAKLPSPEQATVAHLNDARETRDRLLRIVEHKMGVGS